MQKETNETKLNPDNKRMVTMEQATEELKNREQEHVRLVGVYQEKENKYKWCLEMVEDSDAPQEFLKTKLEKLNNDRNKSLLDMYLAFKKFGELAIQVQDAQVKQLSDTITYLKEKYPEILKEFPVAEEQKDALSLLEAEEKQEERVVLNAKEE